MNCPIRLAIAVLCICSAQACDSGAGPSDVNARSRPASYEDWYPEDITPPAGTRYPCALTALPRELSGIPGADRKFINHTYSLILRATQAKLVLLKALEERSSLDIAGARYREETDSALARMREQIVPPGLEPFSNDVVRAITLQQEFFQQAIATRESGGTMRDIFNLPQGRTASQHLFSAWGRMQKRYPSWTDDVSGSIYHHLCALDLF